MVPVDEDSQNEEAGLRGAGNSEVTEPTFESAQHHIGTVVVHLLLALHEAWEYHTWTMGSPLGTNYFEMIIAPHEQSPILSI